MEKAQTAVVATPAESLKKKTSRSPSYPIFGLSRAIERLREFESEEHENYARIADAVGHWGYSAISGPALQIVSSLKQYGFIEERGSNENRQIKISSLASILIHDTDEASPRRIKALQTAALNPPIIAELWKEYGMRPPSDSTFRSTLRIDKKFKTDDAAQAVIDVYRENISFANPLGEPVMSEPSGESSQEINIGDYVQWESQGCLQFPEPVKVTGFSEDGQFAFVEGTYTGIPRGQIMKEKAPMSTATGAATLSGIQAKGTVIVTPTSSLAPLAPLRPGIRREVSSFEEGEAMLQWPDSMTKESILDLEAWLELVIKKLRRQAGIEEKKT